MKKSHTRHVCMACRSRVDSFRMDFIPSTALYVNVRHHPIFPHTALQLVVSSSGLASSNSPHMVTQSQVSKFSIWLATIYLLRHRYPVPPTYIPYSERYLPTTLVCGRFSLFSLYRHYDCFFHILTLSIFYVSTFLPPFPHAVFLLRASRVVLCKV